PKIGYGRIYCSCLDDEQSFELSEFEHGLFTFAFLHENSRRIPQGADRVRIGLRDIGWYQGCGQHPLLIDMAKRDPDEPSPEPGFIRSPLWRFPSFQLLNSAAAQQATEAALQTIQARAAGPLEVHPVEFLVEVCRIARDALSQEEA